MAGKRLIAYIIDMIVLFGLGFLLTFILPSNPSDVKLANLNEQFLEGKINKDEYYREYMPTVHQIDKDNVVFNALTTSFIVGLFVIIPYVTNGQTIGLKVMKLKITSNKDNGLEQYIGRSVFVNGLGYSLLMLILLYIASDNVYFYLATFLAFFQIIVVIMNGFMILYKKDGVGIADKITNTRIEEIK